MQKNTGLVMNCYALRRRMTAARVDKFIRPASAVYMGAVMKYLMAEVLELDKNCAQDMTMMMIETATQRSLHPLNNSTSIPHRIKEKMRQTPEPDAEGMTEEEEEDDPEEEPLRIHITKKEVKKMQLDALSPTFIVSPQHETQKTILSPIYDNAYQEDVLPMTFKRNMMIDNAYQEDMLTMTDQGNEVTKNAYKEDVLPMTFKRNMVINNAYQEDVLLVAFKVNEASNIYKKFAKSTMNETTYQEDMLPMTIKENVFIKDYMKYTMPTIHEPAHRENMEDKTYVKTVVMPTTVAITNSGNNDPADPHKNCVMGKTGTKDGTKRLATTSERGGRGGITKCACGNFATVAQSQLPPASADAAGSLD